MYIMGENPAMSDPDLQHAREALAKLEHLVVQDIFLTETALARRRRAAGLGLRREVRHLHQHRPPGADRPPGARPAGRGAAGLGTDRRPRPAPRPRLELRRPGRGLHRDDAGDAVAEEHHLGAAGARGRGDLSGRRSGQARQRDHLHHRFSDRQRPRQDRAGACAAAGRIARRRVSDGAVHRPRARALAHRLDDAALQRARPDRARGHRGMAPARSAAPGHRGRRHDARRDAARRGRDQGARRSRRAREHGVHAVLLRGGGGQPADQSGARSVRQDPRIQVLRRQGLAARIFTGAALPEGCRRRDHAKRLPSARATA